MPESEIHRGDHEASYPPGGAFDIRFFGLTPDQAGRLGDEARAMLDAVWVALDRAAVPGHELRSLAVDIDAEWDGTDRLLLRTALTHATGGRITAGRIRIAPAGRPAGPTPTTSPSCICAEARGITEVARSLTFAAGARVSVRHR